MTETIQPQLEIKTPDQLNRRRLVRGISILAIGAALGYLSRGPTDSLKDLATGRNAIFRSGQTIDNHVTPIEIDGWNLFFDTQRISDYIKDHPDREVMFTLRYPNQGGYELIDAWGRSKFYSIDTYFPNKNGRRLQRHKVLPNRDIEAHAYLHFVEKRVKIDLGGSMTIEKDGSNIVASEVYSIRVNYFTRNDLTHTVFSEVPLSDTVLMQVAELKRTVLDIRFEDGTAPISNCNVYIINAQYNGKEFGTNKNVGSMLSDNGQVINGNVQVDSAHFTNPSYENQDIMVVHHELAHALMDEIVKDMKDQRANLSIFQGYISLVDLAGLTIPVEPYGIFSRRPKGVEEQPLFRIFREATYLPKRETGHPWSNHGELFASALTVLKFFPEEFLARYRSLDQEQRRIAGNVTQTILGALRFTYRNQSQLREVLPSYGQIQSAIKG